MEKIFILMIIKILIFYGKGFNLDNQVISNSSAIYNFIVNSENKKTINDLLPLDLAISHRRNKVYCISDFEKN